MLTKKYFTVRGEQERIAKREYIAIEAMAAFASNPDWAKLMRTPDDFDEYIKRLSEASVELADALLKELEQN